MLRIGRWLSIIIMVFGLIGVVVGAVFIFQGISKNSFLVNAMKQEKITLGLTAEQVQQGQIVDNAISAQKAADTIRTHRHTIAATYNDLLGGAQFDPTNPKEITYMQALNLENYLYMSVLSFGVVTVVEGAGAFMIITGLVGIFAGLIFLFILKRLETLKSNAV
jgi:hypothetical protein